MFIFSSGIFTCAGQVPSIHLVFFVYWRFRVVRLVISQALLHETVFTVCLDSRCSLDRCYPELSNHPQYFPRTNMVCLVFSIFYSVSYICSYVTRHHYRFIVPVSMIVCNDVMAYMFGFFFGRTPLIKLSPKKTWEGFIGGGFATVIFGIMVA